MKTRRNELTGREAAVLAGGAGSLAASLLHLATLPFGADGLRYFGAGQRLVAAAERGSWVPGAATVGIAAALGTAGLVAAGQVERAPTLPGQRHLYQTVTAVYLLRGAALIPQLALRAVGVDVGPTRELVFSAVALGLGLLHVAGVGPQLEPARQPVAA